MTPRHMFGLRPLAGFSDHRSPIAGLYNCGSSTWPGGTVTGAPGYNAGPAGTRGIWPRTAEGNPVHANREPKGDGCNERRAEEPGLLRTTTCARLAGGNRLRLFRESFGPMPA